MGCLGAEISSEMGMVLAISPISNPTLYRHRHRCWRVHAALHDGPDYDAIEINRCAAKILAPIRIYKPQQPLSVDDSRRHKGQP